MTKVSNAYVTVLNARIETAKSKDASASNIKKLNKLVSMLSNETLATLLNNAKVKAEVFSRAIYATEKVIKFATQAIAFDSKNLNDNTFAIFKTAMNCVKNNVEFTREDARASISKDIKVSDDKKACVYQRNIIQDVSTIAAQSQTSLDALKSLNIISESTEKKNVYIVNVNDLTLKLCKSFDIDMNIKAEKQSKSAKAKAA